MQQQKLLIYCKTITPRFRYITSFLFAELLGLEVVLMTDEKLFVQSDGIRVNYSTQTLACELCITPYGLLEETEVQAQRLNVSRWQDLPYFFGVENADIPFDVCSASFYLLSRYEEYLPYTADEHDRFPVENSIAYRENFLHLPLIDLWMMEIKKMLLTKYSTIEFPAKKMRYLPTYDIDIAFSYIGKELWRTLGGLFRDTIQFNWHLVTQRCRVLLKKEFDPFDSFAFLDGMHEQYALSPIYFLLVGKHSSYDKNLPAKGKTMQQLIQYLRTKYALGVHPSYASKLEDGSLQKEIAIVQSTKSRQHYIKMKLPLTYQNLIECGITEDYSMGYGSRNGFRASTSFPHTWFNIRSNEPTSLELFPFCFMECNSFYEQKQNVETSEKELAHFIRTVNEVGGYLITIWHNFSLGTDKQWAGWREMYERSVQHIQVKTMEGTAN